MDVLYVDESGDDGMRGSTFYVVGGVCIPEGIIPTVQKEVQQLVRKTFRYWKRVHAPQMYFKDDFKSEKKEKSEKKNLPSAVVDVLRQKPELHCSPLIANKPPYDSLDGKARKKLADSVFDIIVRHKLPLFGVAINKTKHFQKYLIPNPVDLFSIEMLVERFQDYLNTNDKRGILVYDQKDKHNNIVFRNFVDQRRRDGTAFSDLSRIIENILFLPSDLCEGLQLADFVAHSIFSHYERNLPDRLNQISKQFFSIKKFP